WTGRVSTQTGRTLLTPPKLSCPAPPAARFLSRTARYHTKQERITMPVKEPVQGSLEAAGLLLVGTVKSRHRRVLVGTDGKRRYCVTVAVATGTEMFVAERWSDEAMPAGTPIPGEAVSLPVQVRPFQQSGVPKYA